MNNGQGKIYSVRRGTTGSIKFGYTEQNAYARLKDVQTGAGATLVLLACEPGTRADEQRIHTALEPFLDHGEWFFPTRTVRQFAQRLEYSILQLKWQGHLPFALRQAHALDTDGRIIKRTSDLTELEFRRIIEIREKQIADDGAYLEELKNAYRTCRPVWDEHPDWTFAQVVAVASSVAA